MLLLLLLPSLLLSLLLVVVIISIRYPWLVVLLDGLDPFYLTSCFFSLPFIYCGGCLVQDPYRGSCLRLFHLLITVVALFLSWPISSLLSLTSLPLFVDYL